MRPSPGNGTQPSTIQVLGELIDPKDEDRDARDDERVELG